MAAPEKFNISPEINTPSFDDLTIFTSTFYKDDPSSQIRQQLALELFDRANTAGVKIVVSDGGSNDSFIEATKAYTNITLVKQPGKSTMGSSRRFALNKALEDAKDNPEHIFFWLEPEKADLVDPETLAKLIQPIRSGEADIAVPSRIDTSSLPRHQAWLEARANSRANNLLQGLDPSRPRAESDITLDLWFGPKVFNERAAKYFADYKGQLDKWDAVIKPVLEASHDGLRILNVPIQFDYPYVQSQYEKDNAELKRKRLVQYSSVLAELGDTFWQHHEFVEGKLRSTRQSEG